MTIDRNDGKPWSTMDDADLLDHVARKISPEMTAEFLCRAWTVVEVVQRAWQLGQPFKP